ncbi:MAG TPA: hypothetical protein VLA20_02070, partial [Vicinamibacterales bacterium]|nr:hypothetical protein [Vicinamibacterales bacterium]
MRGTKVACRWKQVAALGLLTCVLSVPAQAQLDPLIAVKRVPPNVVVVIDTSFRMLDDGTGTYYDPMTYARSYDPTVAAAMGVPSSAT